jgi:very-short-patch-repair endonuclease
MLAMLLSLPQAWTNPSPLWGGVAPKAPGWGVAMPHSGISQRTRGQARILRRKPTDAERKLWFSLRSLKLVGIHFRRQAPIGMYIADFAWHAGKLIVELNGSQHAEDRKAYDEQRTQWLASQGYRVLRFWNNDVLRTPRAVGEEILRIASETPPPPPHKGEGSAPAQAERPKT